MIKFNKLAGKVSFSCLKSFLFVVDVVAFLLKIKCNIITQLKSVLQPFNIVLVRR